MLQADRLHGRAALLPDPGGGEPLQGFVNENPQEARKYLAKNTLTPEDVVDTVPMVRYFMAGELTDKHKVEFQKFIDFSTAVGTLPEKIDITKYLQTY